ncbi:MAG: hypothetical protein ACLQGP_33610 [Isosphaeraceae bacterium]
MKRFALLFGVFVLSIQVTGCGGGISGTSAAAIPRTEDPHLPAEVREWEAKNAKRLADRAEKAALKKAARSAAKHR